MSLQVPAQLVDKAIKRFERESRRKLGESPARPARVITISRQLGSGGRRIAESLSASLGWHLWDKEILDVVAAQSQLGYQAKMFEALDEKTQSTIDAIFYSLFGGVAPKHVYLYLLSKAILVVAQNDAIILGRGAHLLLPESFNVRIVASLETRVKNLVRFEGLSEAVARDRIGQSDQARDAFLQELASRLSYQRAEREKHPEFDLVVSTDMLGAQDAASVVLLTARKAFHIEPDLVKQ